MRIVLSILLLALSGFAFGQEEKQKYLDFIHHSTLDTKSFSQPSANWAPEERPSFRSPSIHFRVEKPSNSLREFRQRFLSYRGFSIDKKDGGVMIVYRTRW